MRASGSGPAISSTFDRDILWSKLTGQDRSGEFGKGKVALVPNSSIFHNVPIMRQPQSWACWYTSFQMVVAYQRRRGMAHGLRDPSEVPWVKAIYDANNGIGATPNEREKVAVALGFKVLYASMSAEGIWNVMQRVPIVYAGHWPGRPLGHFVVLVGISGTRLAINNPATGMETYDYNAFCGTTLLQSGERPLVHP